MTVAEAGRLGGLAKSELVRAGIVPPAGAAVPKPTVCPRCGEVQPSARQAWVHCRVPKGGKKKRAAKTVKKKAKKR